MDLYMFSYVFQCAYVHRINLLSEGELLLKPVICIRLLTFNFISSSPLQQMYIAEVLQDPNLEEAGSGSGEDDGQGSSQDEEIINVENGLNEDFQSGEDSLIDNEVRH